MSAELSALQTTVRAWIEAWPEHGQANAPLLPPDETIQQLLSLALKMYAVRIEESEPEDRLSPFCDEVEITPTEVVKTVNAMLQAADVELFELGMWQNWGK